MPACEEFRKQRAIDVIRESFCVVERSDPGGDVCSESVSDTGGKMIFFCDDAKVGF